MAKGNNENIPKTLDELKEWYDKRSWAKRFINAYIKLYLAGHISRNVLLARTRELRRKYRLKINWETMEVEEVKFDGSMASGSG